ncbi:hypothetical protein [Vibrio owensii]|uniref:hypothetical protein n=1 Tax=Vibrio owensii TaxID=696485 RepID=UPI003CC63C4F
MTHKNPYALSTDYRELYKRLADNQVILAFIDYKFPNTEFVFRDVCRLQMENGRITAAVRGKGYFELSDFDVQLAKREHKEDLNLEQLFSIACKAENLGWIAP